MSADTAGAKWKDIGLRPSHKVPTREDILVVDKTFIEVLVTIQKRLENSQIWWAVGGDAAESMKGVWVKPDSIELLTNKDGVGKIRELMMDFSPTEVELRETKLPREAVWGEKTYPVSIRSHYTEFGIGKVKIKVHGELQYRVGDFEWGDTVEFEPNHVWVVGGKIPHVPLNVISEIYLLLGWTDRLEKLNKAIEDASGKHPH